MNFKERRAHQRIRLGDKVMFGINEPIYEGVSYDLSPNGISIISDVFLPENSKIIIDIDSEIAGRITIEGQVVWVKRLRNLPSKMGIKISKDYPKLIEIYRTRTRYK